MSLLQYLAVGGWFAIVVAGFLYYERHGIADAVKADTLEPGVLPTALGIVLLVVAFMWPVLLALLVFAFIARIARF
jgi:hypothetical protein